MPPRARRSEKSAESPRAEEAGECTKDQVEWADGARIAARRAELKRRRSDQAQVAAGTGQTQPPPLKRARGDEEVVDEAEIEIAEDTDPYDSDDTACHVAEEIWAVSTPEMSETEVDRQITARQSELDEQYAAQQKEASAAKASATSAMSDIVSIRSFEAEDLEVPWPSCESPVLDGRKGSGLVPDDYADQWNARFVRLPCSPQNMIDDPDNDVVDGDGGGDDDDATPGAAQSRWEVIRDALCSAGSPILSSSDLEDAILTYNSDVFDLSGLHYFFNRTLTESEARQFFGLTLPLIIQLAMLLPRLCPKPIPLLLPREAASTTVRLSQMQCASILSNAFLCTIPDQGGTLGSEGEDGEDVPSRVRLPSINFDSLYVGDGRNGELSPAQEGKFRCLVAYFERVTERFLPSRPGSDEAAAASVARVHRQRSTAVHPGHAVSFERRSLDVHESLMEPAWRNSQCTFQNVRIVEKGTIEDGACGELEVDFANRHIGGGVLGRGCVQEEIRFLIAPECIVSRLVTPTLRGGETLVIRGAEQYARYRGYSYTFEFAGAFRQDREVAKRVALVAMDAKNYGNPAYGLPPAVRLAQYRRENLLRELRKAYCGFSAEDRDPSHDRLVGGDRVNADPEKAEAGDTTSTHTTKRIPVATGNWGAGVFGGFHDRAAIIQLLASAQAERPMSYFTFGVPGLAPSLQELVSILVQNKITVAQVYDVVMRVSAAVERRLDGVAEEEEDSGAKKIAQENDELLSPDFNEPPQLFNILCDLFET